MRTVRQTCSSLEMVAAAICKIIVAGIDVSQTDHKFEMFYLQHRMNFVWLVYRLHSVASATTLATAHIEKVVRVSCTFVFEVLLNDAVMPVCPIPLLNAKYLYTYFSVM